MPSITVIGDIMLDAYHELRPHRAAPEGDMIYHIETSFYRPGGSGNLADCLETLGWEVHLWAHLDQSQAAHRLRAWAQAVGIHGHWLSLPAHQSVRVNQRYLRDSACILRLDDPNPQALSWEEVALESLRASDVIVLYDKGSLSATYPAWRDALPEKVFYIDPQRQGFRYPKANCIKANHHELQSLNPDQLELSVLMAQQGWQEFILTQEDQEIVYLNAQGESHRHLPSTCPMPVDPIGAGDAFLAAWISARWQHKSIQESLKIAANAGTQTLKHRGTYAPSWSEINEA